MGQSLSLDVQDILSRRSFSSLATHASKRADPERGPLAVLAPVIKQKCLAPLIIAGPNGTGKSTMCAAYINNGMMTDEAFRLAIQAPNHLEPPAPPNQEYEAERHELGEQPAIGGRPLLTETGYCDPKDVSPLKRGGDFLPVACGDHGTRAVTGVTYGRPCLMLVYRTREEILQLMQYLNSTRSKGASLGGAADTSSLSFDLEKLRLGLELIGKKLEKCSEGNDNILDIVFGLTPADITIPRQCWELAGTIARYYTDTSQPLEQQLEELSKSIWRHTTLVQETTTGGVTGNPHVALIAGVYVTVPSTPLEGLLLMDYVGYIPGDAVCKAAHSQLPCSAGNILTCLAAREHLVKGSLAVVNCSSSLLLQHLVSPRPSTPPLLLVVQAESDHKLREAGDDLLCGLRDALQAGDTAAVAELLAAAPNMVGQLTACKQVTPVAVGRAGSDTAAKLSAAVYHLLNERQLLEVSNVSRFAMKAMIRVKDRVEKAAQAIAAAGQGATAAAAGESLDGDSLDSWVTDDEDDGDSGGLAEAIQHSIMQHKVHNIDAAEFFSNYIMLKDQHRITPLGWWPILHAGCKRLLLQHQEQLQRANIQVGDLIATLADITGVSVWEHFISSNRDAFHRRLQNTVAEAHPSSLRSLEDAAVPAVSLLRSSMSASLQKAPIALVQNPLLQNIQQLEEELAGHEQPVGGGNQRQQELMQAMQKAVAEWQKPHLQRCTAERGLAEGIIAFVGESVLACNVPNWKQELNIDNPDQLVGPDQYSKRLQKLLRGRKLHSWLLSNRKSSKDEESEGSEVLSSPAAYILAPISMLASQQRQQFVDLPLGSHLQRLQLKQQQGQATAVDLARLQLAQLCSTVQQALQLPAGTGPGYEHLEALLAEKRRKVREIISQAFASFDNAISFQHTYLLPEMELKLFFSITTQQALLKKCSCLTRLQLIQEQHAKYMADVKRACDAAVAAQVEKCWQKMLHGLELDVWRPLKLWRINQQQLHQQVQQAEGFCTALRDALVLQYFILGRRGRSSSRHSAISDGVIQAAAELGVPAPSLSAVTKLLAANPSGSCFAELLPSDQQLKQLAEAMLATARHMPSTSAGNSIRGILQRPEWLTQISARLELQPLVVYGGEGALSPCEVLSCWLGVLPAAATVEQLHEALCAPELSGGSTEDSSHAAMVIGSEGYLNLLAQLLKEEGKLPWKLQHTKDLVAANLSELPPQLQPLLSSPVAALPVLQKVNIGQALYKQCHGYTGPAPTYVHNQTLVDAIMLPELLQPAAAGEATAAQPGVAVVLQQLPESAVYRLDVSSDSNTASSSSRPAQQTVTMVRVSSKTLPVDQSDKQDAVVRLEARSAAGGRPALVKLDRLSEYPLCVTRVYNRNKQSYRPTKSQQEVLNQKAPPLVLLAALLLLQQEDQWQQCLLECNATAAGSLQLQRPAAEVADLLFGELLQTVATKQTVTSNSLPAQLVEKESWEIRETNRGGTRFIYYGPLPANAGSSTSSNSTGPVVFGQFQQVAHFLYTGNLPSPGYPSTRRHRSMLASVDLGNDPETIQHAASQRSTQSTAAAAAAAARSSGGANAREPAQPDGCRSARQQPPAADEVPAASNAALEAGASNRRCSKRHASAVPASAVVAADQNAPAGQTQAVAEPANEQVVQQAKRICRNARDPIITIGQAVKESPKLRPLAGQVVKVYILSSSGRRPNPRLDPVHKVKLTEQGAYTVDSNGVVEGGEPIQYIVNMIKSVAGLSNRGWEHVFLADEHSTWWKDIKQEILDQRAAAAGTV